MRATTLREYQSCHSSRKAQYNHRNYETSRLIQAFESCLINTIEGAGAQCPAANSIPRRSYSASRMFQKRSSSNVGISSLCSPILASTISVHEGLCARTAREPRSGPTDVDHFSHLAHEIKRKKERKKGKGHDNERARSATKKLKELFWVECKMTVVGCRLWLTDS